MADAIVSSYSPPLTHPSTGFRQPVGPDISVDLGMPLAPGSNAIFARANAIGTAVVMGLSATAGEAPGHVDIQFAGPITLTTEQWDARTGQSGGLTPHSIYYLSAATAGRMSTNVPSEGNFITPIGFAISSTTMMLQISVPTPS